MKILVFILSIIITSGNLHSQVLQHDIKWRVKAVRINESTFEIKFTVIPSTKWWIASPLQDSIKSGNLLPTEFKLDHNQYFLPLSNLREFPISNETEKFGLKIR